MAILNYTTTIEAQKTIHEISAILAKAKVQAILQEYDGFGNISALNFRVPTEFGIMTFRLPADAERVYKVICRDKALPYSRRNIQQARRVAWRIVKAWVESQMAMVACGMVDMEQVFLPYAQSQDGSTLYENLKARKFEQLALPP